MPEPKIVLVNADRGGIKTQYSAGVEIDGEAVGYVQREAGGDSYRAFIDGLLVSSSHTLAEVRQDIGDYVKNDRSERLRKLGRVDPGL